MRPDGHPAAVMSTTILMSSGRFWSAAGQFRTARRPVISRASQPESAAAKASAAWS
jgi:hypothetical protein